MFNILNGGRHASNSTDFQEFMVVPLKVASFAQALRAGVEVYHALKGLLQERGLSSTVGDEGGFAPSLPSNTDALEMVVAAIERAGYRPGEDCFIALDAAASELFQDGAYRLARESATLTSQELIGFYADWIEKYPVLSIEDGLAEDDWEGWQALVDRLGDKIQLVGDDFYTTNTQRISRGVRLAASNAVLIKPNQIGTLTETLEAVSMTREAGWGAVMSHRSGETEDSTIADLAVAWDTRQIKTGAPCRSERLAKYNRLLRIEEELGGAARYAGQETYGHVKKS
jgi:enolase